jgi:hypothetical protein
MLDEEDVWISMGTLEDDRGVLEAESDIDAVLEAVLIVGVMVTMTLDKEARSTELEDGEIDELWLTSDDRGVLEAASEIDAVLEIVLMVGVIITMTLDKELKSAELEDGETDGLWLTSDDKDDSIELLVELEASVASVTDAGDDGTLDEDDETDELLSVLDAATELDEED